ncbi:unnamed protein product [Orchesella dallaii]|uniref:Uncharacterized protein n=1 Tax=Orchesella dallaii TaxID=48710 RepID=A0ABP1Q4L6_9HEXA
MLKKYGGSSGGNEGVNGRMTGIFGGKDMEKFLRDYYTVIGDAESHFPSHCSPRTFIGSFEICSNFGHQFISGNSIISKMQYTVLILCFVCACTIVWSAQASPMSSATESHFEENHDRVRRNPMEGIMNLFKNGDDNPLKPLFDMAAGVVKQFTQAMGGAKS